MANITPMMRQYLEIKEKHQDAILFYRMGDFYEMFFEDAVTAARELEIALTSRDKQAENPIPMCGVPQRAAEPYIDRLLEKGYKVAICEQVEDPSQAKGLVRREVVRLITPGTLMDNLEGRSPNYLAAVYWQREDWGLAFVDFSTGDFRASENKTLERLLEELGRLEPRELLVSAWAEPDRPWWQQRLHGCSVQVVEEHLFGLAAARQRLLEQFEVQSLESFGLERMPLATRTAGAILAYIRQTHGQRVSHLRHPTPYRQSDYLLVDEVTARHLELFRAWHQGGRKGTLLEILDRTATAMGGRLLRQWMRYPLLEPAEINARQEAVSCCRQHQSICGQIRAQLEKVYDIERLNTRVVIGSAGPRDLAALRCSLQSLPRLKYLLEQLEDPALAALGQRLDKLEDVARLLEQAMVDDPPPTLAEGGVIRPGYDQELERLLSLSRDAKKWIARLQAEERQKTGINSLKVGYNKVFGYYLEVSKGNVASVPERYTRKQTLVNAERYVTAELKEYENQVLSAEDRRVRLEARLFHSLRCRVAGEQARIQASAAALAELDVYTTLAQVASERNYCQPCVDDGREIHIEEGRHPVVEAALPQGSFVPNDVHLDDDGQQVVIVTGPNMAGKSTILRQVAIIVLMAQMGAPVPASSAHIGIVDRIFTRAGATDELTRGRSTFMVEMQETARILHQASERSLVILDEIGRGTSTFDGLSIAWAVAEFLHDWQDRGVKTLFATHYHELTDLADSLPRVRNMNVAVKEWGRRIIFLRKLVPGGSSRSYGIQVARLAGLPESVVERAKEVLGRLEQHNINGQGLPRLSHSSFGRSRGALQLSLFQQPEERLRRYLEALELDRLTPLEALNQLARLRKLAEKGH